MSKENTWLVALVVFFTVLLIALIIFMIQPLYKKEVYVKQFYYQTIDFENKEHVEYWLDDIESAYVIGNYFVKELIIEFNDGKTTKFRINTIFSGNTKPSNMVIVWRYK